MGGKFVKQSIAIKTHTVIAECDHGIDFPLERVQTTDRGIFPMKSRGLTLCFSTCYIVVLLLGFGGNVSYSNYVDMGLIRFQRDHFLSSSLEQYVENNLSDVDGMGSLGTHSNFASQQAGPDATVDVLTEENTEPIPTDAEDDYDSYVSDVDSTPDVGTETNPTNAQGSSLDFQYMTLQEEDTGAPYQSTWLDTDQYDGLVESSLTTVGTSPYLDVQDYPTNYVSTKTPGSQGGWWQFPNTTLTGELTVNVSIYCWNVDGTNDDG
ncbi:MAG: hypothetical protein ACFFE6_10410, partial [Candidatus Thorarchaeota archaeon]